MVRACYSVDNIETTNTVCIILSFRHNIVYSWNVPRIYKNLSANYCLNSTMVRACYNVDHIETTNTMCISVLLSFRHLMRFSELGDECTSLADCLEVIPWSSCDNKICACAPGYKKQNNACVKIRPAEKPGKLPKAFLHLNNDSFCTHRIRNSWNFRIMVKQKYSCNYPFWV